jgi:hypothetical protein
MHAPTQTNLKNSKDNVNVGKSEIFCKSHSAATRTHVDAQLPNTALSRDPESELVFARSFGFIWSG